MKRIVIVLGLTVFFTIGAWSQIEQSILPFKGPNGSGPYTGLTQDSKGNFYGAASNGGTYGNGVVYELTSTEGKWKQRILYSFSGGTGDGDGAYPQMPWLAIDKDGRLYGTTPGGGAYGHGTVFELSPASPLWKETILYSFTGAADGSSPIGGVTLDSKGNLYGTTNGGGDTSLCDGGCGVTFELSPSQHAYRVLHTFEQENVDCGIITDGANPNRTTLAFDSAGNIFGTTSAGGLGCGSWGTVWELSPAGKDWAYSQVYVMGTSGIAGDAYPDAGGVFDSDDNFYFAEGGGNVYELLKADGYSEQIIYQYPGPGADDVADTVAFDKAGNLYWTSTGYNAAYYGGVYELSPNGSGGWNYQLLYAFSDNQEHGTAPWAGVTIGASGTLYGTCTTGGGTQYPYDNGTVWEIKP